MELGNIKVIAGDNGGKFPFCNSVLINDSVKVLIDPGAGFDKLVEIKNKYPIDMVINSHYHFDHIAFNHIFNESKIYINETEGNCFKNREEIASRLGMVEIYGQEWVSPWLGRISRKGTPQSPFTPQNRHEWWLSTARLDGTYSWGEVLDFGGTKMEVIGTPGHTEGFSCFFFPEQGAVYTGDIDLTGFGPWYCGRDGNIDIFIESVKRIVDLQADIYITGHEAGILPRAKFLRQVEGYVDMIAIREERIASILDRPHTIKEITELGLIYGQKFLIDHWVWAWEELVIKKHLERLVDKGLVSICGDKYVMC